MDEAYEQVVKEAQTSFLAKGLSAQRAEKRARNGVEHAVQVAADQPDPYYFFQTLGVSKEAFDRLEAATKVS
ncbi:MAG: hypothetical protein KBD50_01660 [Candidatus Pacebacteria bacterium]|nr:hypothetical protein [Candidatus Paceibacterota bacterium]